MANRQFCPEAVVHVLTHCSTYDSSVTAPPREVVYGGSGYPSSHEKGLHFKLRSAVAFISGPLILFSIFFKRQLLIPGHIRTKKFPCPGTRAAAIIPEQNHYLVVKKNEKLTIFILFFKIFIFFPLFFSFVLGDGMGQPVPWQDFEFVLGQ